MSIRIDGASGHPGGEDRSSATLVALWPVLLLLVIGLYGYALRAIGFFNDIPGDLGDARFNSVVLEHVFQWVTGKEASLWSPRFFFPFPDALAFSDNHFGSAPVYVLLRAIGLDREIGFAAWFLIGNIANFGAAYWSLRRLGFSRFGSGLGAFVFAFALPALPKEGHAQLVYRFAIPVCYAYFVSLIRTHEVRHLRQVCIFLAIQFFCSIYLGIFLAYLLAATLLANLLVGGGRGMFPGLMGSMKSGGTRQNLVSTLVALASAVAVGALLFKYHRVSGAYGFVRPISEVATMLPRPGSYLLAEGSSLTAWLGRYVDGVPMRHEHQMFVGFGVALLAFVGVFATWRARHMRTMGQLALIALLVLVAGTLLVGGHSLYTFVLSVPGLGAVRAVSRIVLVLLLPVAILVAIGGEWLMRSFGRRSLTASVGVVFFCVALLGTETSSYHSMKTPISAWRERQATLQAMLPAKIGEDTILLVTKHADEPRHYAELDAAILAQDRGVATLNGYSGNFPPGYLEPFACMPADYRLRTYQRFTGAPDARIEAYSKRIRTLALEPCAAPPLLPFFGSVNPSAASSLKLSIEDVEVSGSSAKVRVRLANNGAESFRTLSGDGNSVFLSWRFVPVDTYEASSRTTSWDTRATLEWTIGQGESLTREFDANLPTMPGRYLLQVTLVQENVVWLHDIGLEIAGKTVAVATDTGAEPDDFAGQAPKIAISIAEASTDGSTVHAKVIIQNGSDELFNAFGEGAIPVRLSWRLVPDGSANSPGWDTRHDLPWNIAAGNSADVALEFPLPKGGRNYVLEVTLVREYVAWLHDQGLKIASAKVEAR